MHRLTLTRLHGISVYALPARFTCSVRSPERVTLCNLVWDITCRSFDGWQVLYECFFASDPLMRAQFQHAIYPKEELMERVRAFAY